MALVVLLKMDYANLVQQETRPLVKLNRKEPRRGKDNAFQIWNGMSSRVHK